MSLVQNQTNEAGEKTMCIRKSILEIIAITVLACSVGSVLAANHNGKGSRKSPVAVVSTRVNPVMTPPTPVSDDRGFIDTGVLESADVLEGSLEIGGLLVDDTLSKIGHELFDVFNRAWKPVEGARYNIAFGERIDPIRGSLMSVKLNDTVIFEGFLTPREEAINELGKGLAKDIRNLVRNTATLEEEEFY